MAESIRQLIAQIADQNMPEIIIGVVTEVNPVKIIQKDDIGVIISNVSLIIPSSKKPLVLGEELYLLAISKKKIFYVLDRV